MKKLLLILLVSFNCFGAVKHIRQFTIADKSQIKSFSKDDADSDYADVIIRLNSITDRVTIIKDSEAEADAISIGDIDTAILAKIALKKDITNISKLEKAGFLVVMDYLRSLGLSKTNAEFKSDVVAKYDSL